MKNLKTFEQFNENFIDKIFGNPYDKKDNERKINKLKNLLENISDITNLKKKNNFYSFKFEGQLYEILLNAVEIHLSIYSDSKNSSETIMSINSEENKKFKTLLKEIVELLKES